MKTMSFVLVVSMTMFPCMAQFALSAENPHDLTGVYSIFGWDPGKTPEGVPDYWGEATLRSVGDTWQYRAGIDGMTYAGAGIYEKEYETLSLSFSNGDGSERGVAVLHRKGRKLTGQWVMDTGSHGKVGIEIWTKKK